MFAIGITKHKLELDSELELGGKTLHCKCIKIGNYFVQIVIDNSLSYLVGNDSGYMIFEDVLQKNHEDKKTKLSVVLIDKREKWIEIIKPTISGRPIFYYHSNDGGEFYCSTHISLLDKFGVPIYENEAVIPELFVYQYVMPPITLFRDIRRMLMGETLKVTLNRDKIQISLNMELNLKKPSANLEKTTIGEFAKNTSNLLLESLRNLKSSKNNIALLVSGGLDSTILFKLTNRLFGTNHTFSTYYKYENTASNIEKEYAIKASKVLKTQHSCYSVPDYPEDLLYGLLKAIYMAEEPLHWIQYLIFYIFFDKGIPAENNILINGQGADGVFGSGFQNGLHFAEKSVRKHRFALKLFLNSHIIDFIKLMPSIHNKSLYNYINGKYLQYLSGNNNIEDPNCVIYKMGAGINLDWAAKYFNTKRESIILNRKNFLLDYQNHQLINQCSILDVIGEVDATQSIWSKLAEASNKSIYYPFNDMRLLEYVYSIPWDIKLEEPKNILRRVGKLNGIPEFIITQRKSGFSVSREKLCQKGGIFEPLVPLCAEICDLKDLYALQEAGEYFMFWKMLNYAIWKRLFILKEPLSDLLDELQKSIQINKESNL